MARASKKAVSAKQKTSLKKKSGASKKSKSRKVIVSVGTRKGAWFFRSDGARKTWKVDGPHFLGQIINHVVIDPRDGKTVLSIGSDTIDHKILA